MLVLYVLTNIAIFLGYFTIARFIVPKLNINYVQTKIGGLAFFFTCALTHVELAYHAWTGTPILVEDFTSWHMLAVHIPQAIAVWLFTYGLYRETTMSKGFFQLDRNRSIIKGIMRDLEELETKASEEDLNELRLALRHLEEAERRIVPPKVD